MWEILRDIQKQIRTLITSVDTLGQHQAAAIQRINSLEISERARRYHELATRNVNLEQERRLWQRQQDNPRSHDNNDHHMTFMVTVTEDSDPQPVVNSFQQHVKTLLQIRKATQASSATEPVVQR